MSDKRSIPSKIAFVLKFLLVVAISFKIEPLSLTFVGLICVIWLLCSIGKSAAARDGIRPVMLRIASPILAYTLIAGNMYQRIHLADRRGDVIAGALEQFHATQKRYPEKLEELVPGYLETIPTPQGLVMGEHFAYFNNDGRVQLFYLLGAFNSRHYSFEYKRWGTWWH